MTVAERKIDLAWKLLRGGFALVPFAAGLDKFLGLLADWEMYLSPTVANLLPVAPATFLRMSGVVEMAVGLLMLTRWVRFAAYAASAWLVAIAINLVMSGMFFDVAVRDLALALAAFVLALLTEARAARPASAAA
jgi:hypothetical protein